MTDNLNPMDSPVIPPPAHSGSANRFMSTSATFILLLLTLFSSLAALYAISISQESSQTLSRLQSQLHKDNSRTRELEVTLVTLNEAHAGLQNQLSKFISQIKTTAVPQDQLVLIVEQARGYLELAQIESKWENNESMCLILLNNAMKLLQTTKDDSLNPVLDAIRETQQEINSKPRLDLTTLFHQFHALEEKLIAMSPQLAIHTQAPSSAPVPTNQTEVAKTLDTLKHLVVIKQHAQANLPHVSLQMSTFIDRILINLQVAKLAILQNNKNLYELALKQAIQDINVAFNKQPELKQAFLETVNQLSQVQLSTTRPDIEKSINLLNQWLQTQQVPPREKTS